MPPPAATPPAAPAKPAASPATTLTAPTAAPVVPATPAAEAPKHWLDESNTDLDAMDDGKPAPKPAEKPPVESLKKPEGVKAPDDKVDDKTGKPITPKPDKPPKAADLRAAYDGLKQRVAQDLEPKLARLEAENAELKKNGGADAKTLTEKIAAVEKRNAELESEMRFVDYSKSTEFQQKYAEPLKKAWARAIADLKEIQVETDDGAGGLRTREATTDDIVQLANMPLGAARKTANAMFGDNADDVMAHVRNLRQLSDAQQEALAEARKTADERTKTLATERTAGQQRAHELWQTENKTLAEKYPKWFAPDAEDPEATELLNKSIAFVDRMFTPTEDTAPKTVEERVRLHAAIRNRAIGFLPMAHRLKAARARIAELEKELEGYNRSAPPTDKAGAPSQVHTGTWRDDTDREIEALDNPQLR